MKNNPFIVAALRRVGVTMAFLALALVLLVTAWTVLVYALQLDAFGTPTPAEVWNYWALESESNSRRAEIFGAALVTLGHAAVGYAIGTFVGFALAVTFVAVPRIERATLPVVLVVQTIPILAILPLFILVFGRGLLVTTIITALTVFFPTLVWVSQGLRSPKSTTLDFFHSAAATPWTIMLRLRLPSAVSGVFVAARLSVPGAIFGAFVSEWLATGNGLGYLVVLSMQGIGGYAPLWAVISVTTLLTMAIYVLVELAESTALAYYAPERLIKH